jgi:hypothetical protein
MINIERAEEKVRGGTDGTVIITDSREDLVDGRRISADKVAIARLQGQRGKVTILPMVN